MPAAQTIEEKALLLPTPDRAKLAHRLLESLDDLSPAEIEQLWVRESERRIREHRASGSKGISKQVASSRIRKRLTR